MDHQEIGKHARAFLDHYEETLNTDDELPMPIAFRAWAAGRELSDEEARQVARRLDQLQGVSFDVEIRGDTAEMVRRLIKKLDLPAVGVIGHALKRLEWKLDREAEGLKVVAVPRDRTEEVEPEGEVDDAGP